MGLKMPAYHLVTQIKNNPSDLQSAAYALLREWRNTQINSRIAFQNLCEALKESDMSYLLYVLQHEVLQDDSVSGESQVRDVGQLAKIIEQSGKLKTWTKILYHSFPSYEGTFI